MLFTRIDCGVHGTCSDLPAGKSRSIVVEAINHGTVTVLQHRPALSIFFVRLHPDAEQEHHTPVPAIFQGHVEIGAGPLKERGRGNEEDKVHLDLLVMAPERSAVDKLLAKEVLVPDIKAAEDLNLRPFHTTPAAFRACSLLHAPH